MSTFLYSYKLKFWTKKSIVMNYDKLFLRFLEFDITLRWFNLPADKYWQSLEWHVLWHSYWLARDIWCVTHLQANIFSHNSKLLFPTSKMRQWTVPVLSWEKFPECWRNSGLEQHPSPASWHQLTWDQTKRKVNFKACDWSVVTNQALSLA